MRPDLPWNVAGISPEAREAARAAARREGLSVGEWLTRRIVAGLSDMSEPQQSRADWTPRGEYRPEPERQRRDSDAMLDCVSRSESETAEVYRRIEEQLRGMARRLDASERSQTESNRVMSKAAVEMNIAAREQAQAFDQLGAHVTSLTERLDRVEARDPGEGVREAVKALHQGLSRLADQISQTASQSASQISSLANNLETVAGRVGQARHDSLVATQALETRLATIDERVRTLEAAAQANAGSLDRALQAIEAQKRSAAPTEALVHLQDSVRRLEERSSVDPSIDRRLGGIERTLADVVARIEPEDKPDSVESSLHKIVQRLESLETAQREAAAELRKAAEKPRPVEEPPPAAIVPPPVTITQPLSFAQPPQTQSSAAFGPLPAFEPPPFVDAAVPPPFAAAPGAPPPFVEPLPAFEPPPPVKAPFAPPAAETAAPPTTVESYLAAARRSARLAAQAETERNASIGGLRWGSDSRSDEGGNKRTRPLIVGLAVMVGIAVIAGAILSRQASPPAQQAVAVQDRHAAKTPPKAPAPEQTASVLHPASEDVVSTPPAPSTAKKPVVVSKPHGTGLLPSGVAVPPPVTQIASRQPQQQPAVARPTPTAPLDRLTTAANAGNSKAQLIVGLKYLDGDGVPANDAEAAKWLMRAADAGEPVAQYRLGTLFERGRGVPADPVKAVRWYQAAANQGSRKAMHNLAVAYAEGTGVKKDFSEASRWFLRAANLGLSDSQFNLAVLYERGLGVPQNLVDAYKWYAIAAAQGDAESKTRLSAIAGQLDTEARAAAQHAADTFRPGQLDARANVAPTVADVTRG
jgi:localization factor PodJL